MKAALLCATLLGTLSAAGAQAGTSTLIGRASANRPVSFDVVLPLRNKDALEALLLQLHDPKSPQFHQWLTPAEFGRRFGPDSATISRVAAALQARGFTIAKTMTRSLRVTGDAAHVEASFGTHVMLARTTEGQIHLATDSDLKMPAELTAAGAQIFSFSPHAMHTMSRSIGKVNPLNRYSANGGYWFDDLKQAYSYPANTATVTAGSKTVALNGTGATIGALMASDILPSDIQASFDHENWSTISGTPDPTITIEDINGGGGLYGGAFVEASLDTQEEITGAPGANVILYSIPSLSDGDIFAGYSSIVEENKVDVISSSFGECELLYFPQYNAGHDYRGVLVAEHELFQQGNAQGITFLVSSGDSAGKECPSLTYFSKGNGKFVAGVSTPASDPAVTAVGGTNVITGYDESSLASPYVAENAYDDPELRYDPYGIGGSVAGGAWGAGGGYSKMWPQPAYQALVNTGSTTARALPDVGMQVGGCPGGIAADYSHHLKACTGGTNPLNDPGNTARSYVIVAAAIGQGGGFYGVIGTSVSSPEFAGAIAPLVALNGRMGNLNTYLYSQAAAQAAGKGTFFHTSIPGYNGVQSTYLNPGYSLSVGVGTPIVTSLLGLPPSMAAGNPQTTSNP